MTSRASLLVLTFILAVASVSSGCRTVRSGTGHLPRQAFIFIHNQIVFQACLSDSGEDCATIGQGLYTGSGFMVASNGIHSWGITAGHLCVTEPPSGSMMVDPATGKTAKPRIRSNIKVIWLGGQWIDAVVEEVHPNLDLCVLRLENVNVQQVVEVAPEPPQHGDRVYVLSAPLGTFDDRGMLLTFEGYYSGSTADIPPPMGGRPVIFDGYTVPSKSGSSGSPIMNAQGQLVGVTSVALRNFENLALSPSYTGVAAVVRGVQERAYNRESSTEGSP